MANTFEDLRIDNSAITALELLELARETQLKVYDKAIHRYDIAQRNNYKNKNAKYWMLYKQEGRKLDYIEYLIRQLKEEKKNK